MEVSKNFAKYFYERCAGASTGHMAMIPNNPEIFGFFKVFTESNNSNHSATVSEFAKILHAVADKLEEK